METKRQFKDVENFDETEAIESAVKKRKFLLNRLIEPMDTSSNDSGSDSDSEETEEEE